MDKDVELCLSHRDRIIKSKGRWVRTEIEFTPHKSIRNHVGPVYNGIKEIELVTYIYFIGSDNKAQYITQVHS